MPHLLCYDITGNTLRAKLGRTILDYGLDRINKSVYLGTISERSLKELETKLTNWIKTKGGPTDSLIIITVHAQQVQDMKVLGRNDLDRDELTGSKTTIVI